VSLGREDGHAVLSVEDNGPGLPQGFSLDSPSTLGLTLITSLARQLGGVVMAQALETGARFSLVFPVEETA
jgi:two-component sensor histidine kinase